MCLVADTAIPSVRTIRKASGVRRRVVSTQGYAPRFRTGHAGDVVDVVRRLACVQLDSISTVWAGPT